MAWKTIVVVLVGLAFGLVHVSEALQPTKVYRIGFLSAGSASSNPPRLETFRRGLRDLGYFEGKNIVIEYRYMKGNQDLIPSLVAELVQLKVDVLVSAVYPAIRAAKQATNTIPIVMVITQDPVKTGLVDSLARPGGNVTGLTGLTRELSGKRLELLKEVVPRLRVGVLGDANVSAVTAFEDYETAARALKIPLQSLEVRGPNPDFEGAFKAAAKHRVNGLVTIRTVLLVRYPKRIAELAIKNRLPSMHEGNEDVEAGGLMSYSANDADSLRRAAFYVDRILKGAKPADLPIELPTKFEFVINLKTAKQIGLTIPQSVLFRADKVIK
jgi:putative tryptophan/tyrosine transport system substrate-binding protein